LSFGLTALGSARGHRVRVEEAALSYTRDLRKLASWGYRSFHRADPDTGLVTLSVSAAEAALERGGLAAEDVDLIVVGITDIAEYLYWDVAAAIQGRLGARNAETVLLNHACASGVMAFDVVGGKFATHPAYSRALIVAANRVCEPYWNRMESNTSIGSDGAAAAVAVRGATRNRWLCTETITDGRFADIMRLEVGGAAAPWTGNSGGPQPVGDPVQRMKAFFRDDTRAMLDFAELGVTRTVQVLERACGRAGVTPSAVKRVFHLNDNLTALTGLAAALGIPLSRTNADIAVDAGHFGSADQLLALEAQLGTGEIASGDIIALTSMGSGMHWSCTLLEI